MSRFIWGIVAIALLAGLGLGVMFYGLYLRTQAVPIRTFTY